MIKIPIIDNSNLDSYYLDAKPIFLNYLFLKKDADKCSKLIDYLEYSVIEGKASYNDSKLKKLLTGDLSCLKSIVKQIGMIKKDNLSDDMYDEFVKTNSGLLIPFFSGTKVCPYCNRVPLRVAKEHIRPAYDHFLSRSDYAYLSISIYNLIPCCADCNNLKRTHGEFLYPYSEEFGDDVVFEISNYNNSKEFEIDIVIKNESSPIISKAKGQIQRLGLDFLYGSEQERAYRIIRAIEKYNKKAVEALNGTYDMTPHSVEECLCEYLNKNISRSEWHKEEFSKFTHDICFQFLDN